MQFIIPQTPNLYEYFSSLSKDKKVILALTLLSFIGGGSSLALGVYGFLAPPAGFKVERELASPIGFFGLAGKINLPGFDPNAKTVPSPLNGVLYSEAEAKLWQARRPMAVMVNNHVLARPQTGLSQADIIYEAVAEGGISRFLAVFHSKVPEKVGPVRSARKYYVDFAKENDAWFGHWGGAATANEANVYDYMRGIYVSSIDAMWAGSSAFWRDFSKPVPTEHTGYTAIPKLYETGYRQYPDQVKELRPLPATWSFKEDAPASKRPEGGSLSFNFWDLPDFKVVWDYDKISNSYQRRQGGKVQVDAETNQPLMAKDVVVLFMDERSLNDGKGHLLYKTTGSGLGRAFVDGQAYDLTWVRKNVQDRTQFLVGSSKNLEELKLNRGQIWIEIVPSGSVLTVN